MPVSPSELHVGTTLKLSHQVGKDDEVHKLLVKCPGAGGERRKGGPERDIDGVVVRPAREASVHEVLGLQVPVVI